MIISILKRKKYIVAGLTIAMVLAVNGIMISTSAGEPAANEDPIVTQSYVDAKIDAKLTEKAADLTKQNADLTKQVADLKAQVEELSKKTSTGSSDSFALVEAKNGQSIICGESTQLILRSGKAKAIASATGGLADLTGDSGLDLKTGVIITANHLILIPRDDGRGIKITSDSSWVMIKGKYEIR